MDQAGYDVEQNPHNSRFTTAAAFLQEGHGREEFTVTERQTCTTYALDDEQVGAAERRVLVVTTVALPSVRPVEFTTTNQRGTLTASKGLVLDAEPAVVLGTGTSEVYSVELLRMLHDMGVDRWRQAAC